MRVAAVVLAAGRSKRMGTTLPKVCQLFGGKPMLSWVMQALKKTVLVDVNYVVVGEQLKCHHQDFLNNNLGENDHQVFQRDPLGTGDALKLALPEVQEPITLVVLGDVPLLQPEVLKRCVEWTRQTQGLVFVSTQVDNPSGYGRIVRDSKGDFTAIVEEKHADSSVKKIKEINTGLMCVPTVLLRKYLPKVDLDEVTGEILLTDLVAKVRALSDSPTHALSVDLADAWRYQGVNTMAELVDLQRQWNLHYARQLMACGVRVDCPQRLTCHAELSCDQDVSLGPDVYLEGVVSIGAGSVIEQGVVLRNSIIGSGVRIKAYSVIESSVLGDDVTVGPFAYCRQGTQIQDQAQLGSFVESKNTFLGQRSKAKHLSYLGDLEIGADVNIGAGFIHCNYDGLHKYQSSIDSGSFIGADSQLIGPLKLGKNTLVGAGSTVTDSVEDDRLVIARARQVVKIRVVSEETGE